MFQLVILRAAKGFTMARNSFAVAAFYERLRGPSLHSVTSLA
jgi:hypothetical protein